MPGLMHDDIAIAARTSRRGRVRSRALPPLGDADANRGSPEWPYQDLAAEQAGPVSAGTANAGISPIRDRGQAPPVPWQTTLGAGKPPFLLRPGQCLAYRQLPAGYANAVEPSELRIGSPYSFVAGSAERGQRGLHAGAFCFEQAAEDMKMVQVPRPPAAVTADICRQLLDTSLS
ncbi:hypothetical protein GCM10009090_37760 [[Pseudomonas] boreopolis]|uniref:Uncharacterized protein n=1 Tax=Xanthomonas boreopolis TaxID=86183 RepID=A0A919KK49_9XANT|nr:hypothetical protein GCM10009090_37760 [[Pseudomonas] boreopolis]